MRGGKRPCSGHFVGTLQYRTMVRRELGLTFVTAMARHRLQREPFIGMSRAALRAMRDARGLAARRDREAALPDQWVYDFFRHQAPGGRGEVMAARA